MSVIFRFDLEAETGWGVQQLVPKPRVNPGSSPGQTLGATPEACVQY
ncbi:MAG: hypothetical protein P8163_06875 [Candidatus Thiodiazotropha sp.]